jgi:uncharacterized protein RhaS with RHS repeats
LSRRKTLAYPHGVTTTYGYDDLNRLTSLVHQPQIGQPIATYGYTHDQAGNRTTESGTVNETYAYDDIYRLTQAATPIGTENFTYDDVGNRLTGPGAKDSSYQHNDGNQMITGRTLTYLYDNRGNQTTRTVPGASDKNWTLTWDFENRLTKMERIKGLEKRTITFKYDPMGRRIEKKQTTTIDGVTKTVTTTYVYDGDNIALELASDGTTTSKTFYTHGQGTDEHLAMERTGQNYYFHADGLGSITAITDQTRNKVQEYTTTPSGW